MRLAGIVFSSWVLACSFAHAETPRIALFASPADAVREILRTEPAARVLAFGEIHELTGGPKATPAIRHFSDEMLAALPTPAELVVETWITQGSCGEVEHKVVAQVEQMTKRPESTETDIVRLLRLGKAAGLRPHILELSCATYRSLQNTDGGLDAVKLLGAVTVALRDTILGLLRGRDPVIVYGGALHNDRQPRAELAAFSFGRTVERAAKQRYLEIDLYVPEYVESDPAITGTRAWAKYAAAIQGHADQTALVRLAAGSYIIVFPRAAARP
jgi:peptidoglycan hydrolase-like protein with peptidoglycan-binding domain